MSDFAKYVTSERKRKRRRSFAVNTSYVDWNMFDDIAREFDMTQKETAYTLAQHIPPDIQFQQQYDRFQRDYAKFYNQDPTMDLADPVVKGMAFQAWQTKRNFKYWRQEWPQVFGPDTFMAHVGLPELSQLAMSQMWTTVFDTFGDKYSSAALQAALSGDPEQRAETWALLQDLAQQNTIGATGLHAGADLADNGETLLREVLINPGVMDTYTMSQKAQVAKAAKVAIAQQEEVTEIVDTGLAGEIEQSFDVFAAAKGASIVLSKDEMKQLQGLIPSLPTDEDYDLQDTSFFTTNIDVSGKVGNLGITHFRNPGEVPHFVFDPEWAKNNFAKHTGIIRQITDLYPNATFQYGSEGVMGSAMALLDRSTDDIAAIPGALAIETHEVFESFRFNPEERASAAAEEQRLRRMIENGEIPLDQLDAAVSQMFQMKDRANGDVGGLVADVRRQADPSQFGTGFGDSLTTALTVYPGDSEYNMTHAIGSLIGQIAFDPAILFAKPIKAIRLAGKVPLGAKVSNSAITQTLFDFMAMEPDVLLATRNGKKLVDGIGEAAATFDDWAAFSNHLQKTVIPDVASANRIAKIAKEEPQNLHASILSWMGGQGARADEEADILGKLASINKSINVVDNELPKALKSLKAKVRRRQASIDKSSHDLEIVQDEGTEIATIRGWHGRDTNLLPVTVPGERLTDAGFHFGTKAAANERLAQKGMPIDKPFQVWFMDGEVYRMRLGSASSLEEAQRSIETIKRNASMFDLPSNPTLEIVETTPTIMPIEVRGKFLGLTTPYEDWGAGKSGQFLRGSGMGSIESLDGRMRAIYDQALAEEKTVRDYLMSKGYDGIIYQNAAEDVGSQSVVVFDMAKIQRLDDELQTMLADIDRLQATRAEMLPRRTDMLSKKMFWESVLEGVGDDPLIPLHRLPSQRSIRGLKPAETRFGKMWEAATQEARLGGHKTLDQIPESQRLKWLEDHPEYDKKANAFLAMARRWGQNTGSGKKLTFFAEDLPKGALGDEIAQSYQALRDFGREIGAPESVIDDMLTNIIRATDEGSRPDVYHAFTEGYVRMLDRSRLDQTGKETFSDMWPELSGERAPGMVKTGSGTSVQSMPTTSVPHVGENGDVSFLGVPSIEADMFRRPFTLPTREQLRDHISSTRSYLRGMQEAGGLGKSIAGAYFGLTHAWRGFNAAWARAVLLGRMPLALPARIQLEQMIRVEAFGYHSLVRHPISWFKSVKGSGEFGRVAASPESALGVMIRDYFDDTAKFGRRGRKTFNLNVKAEEKFAIRALAGRLKAYSSSPSFRVFINKKLSDTQVLEKLREDQYFWRNFGTHWDDVIAKNVAGGGELTSYEKIIKNIRLEMNQVIGKGPGAKQVLGAAKSGRIKVGDKTFQIRDTREIDLKTGKTVVDDSEELADELLRMYRAGEWKPDVYQFPGSWADYMPPSRGNILGQLKKASDWAFHNFYARPDLALGRKPLARQIASREYDRLRKLGYSKDGAEEAARIYGARQTADLLFTIGANSSADYWLRSFMPFFPAWKELAATWLVKIPRDVGGGGVTGWVVGAPAVARRIDAWVDFFVDTGIVHKEGDQWRVNIPGGEKIVELFTGMPNQELSFSADSLTSLLPTPSMDADEPFWKGMLPTVGAPTGMVLHTMSEKFGGIFEEIENTFTLFGGDQSLGPASIDYIAESFGITMPWMSGQTSEMHEIRKNGAFIDALRVKYEEAYGSKPKLEDYKNEQQYLEASAAWLEDLYIEAENASQGWYLLRGISSMVLPFSIKYTDDANTELSALWDVINTAETELDDRSMITPLLEGLRQSHPELELYLTGKSISLVPDNPERVDSYETYIDEIKEGTRLAFTPEQWLVWALGNQEAALHRSRLNEIFNKFAGTPQQWLLSDFQSSKALNEENRRWDLYLEQSKELANIMDVKDDAGQPTSFAQMYDQFYQAKVGRYSEEEQISLTLEQQKATEAMEALESLSRFFGAGRYTDDEYLAVKRTLNEIADKDYESKDPVFGAINWWWDQHEEYFDSKDAIWRKIDATPSSARGPLYRQLADIENEWATKTIKHQQWGVFPSVQEVMFQKLSRPAQDVRLYGWAKLPVEFLSRYQRQKVYGKTKRDNALDELTQRIGVNEHNLEVIVDTNAISTSSLEYDALRARTDRLNMQAAADLKVADIYKTWQQPAYKRVSTLINNPYWTQTVRIIDAGATLLEKAEVSPRGSTTAAVVYQRRAIQAIEMYRQQDREFDKLMEKFEIAYGEGADEPAIGIDMYWALFFDGFGTAPGYLNYY